MINSRNLKNMISPLAYFSRELPNFRMAGHSKWLTVKCLFHSDSNPSMRVNLESGGFCCLACGAKGGDIISFEMQRSGLSFIQAVNKIASQWGLR